MVPKKVFYTKGVGAHKEYLASFETALRAAGIAPYNLVSVSSILPPGCQRISREEGIKLLSPGSIVHVVMARQSTNEPNRLIAASIGAAVPNIGNDQYSYLSDHYPIIAASIGAAKDNIGNYQYGYLSEHHPFGETEEKAGEYAEDLAASMLASTLGIEFNVDSSWDEKEQAFKMSGKIVRTFNVTQSALGNKDGLWTSVVAAAVFIIE